MIKNLYQKIELYCGNHNPPKPVEPRMSQSLFYACENYYKDGEMCVNRISALDYERMVEVIDDAIGENIATVNLTGYKFRIKTLYFEVFEYGDKIKVKFTNGKRWKGKT